MKVSYTYHPDQHHFLTKVLGTIELQDVLTHFDTLIADDSITEPCFEIVDLGEAKNFDFGYYQSDSIMSRIKQFKQHRPYLGSFLIAHSDYFRGIGNMFHVVGEQMGIQIDIAESLEDALSKVTSYFS
ncbi:MAG: hypothetical protein GKR91_20600 [Pseudomonadales bacterium]|nr:hypothetical protein [Pseudomonadales bacterium]